MPVGKGMGKDTFIAYIKGAMGNAGGAERKQLYFELLRAFTDADKDYDGSVSPLEFDSMIESAAEVSRQHGLAPLVTQIYKSVEERQKGRALLFDKMDENHDGNISLDEWLGFCYAHINAKLTTTGDAFTIFDF